VSEPEQTIDESLARYFEARQRDRNEEVDRTLNALGPQARGILHDAAVMGFVLGERAGYAKRYSRFHDDGAEEFPTDSEIIRWVVMHCCAQEDRAYPTINRARRRGLRLARKSESGGAS
jgi:hypothetical protein